MIKSRQTYAIPALFAALSSLACDSNPPPNPAVDVTAIPAQEAPTPDQDESPSPSQTADLTGEAEEEEPPPPWEGPFLGITRSSAGVYSEPSRSSKNKIAYVQEGSAVPVHPDPEKRDNCKQGWYRVVSGGYICGNDGTTDLSDPRVKLGPKQPDLEGILPYQYARNAHNGTPLYRSVPSLDQIKKYEPWRFKDEKPKAAEPEKPADKAVSASDEVRQKALEDQARRMAALRAAQRAMLGEEAARKLEAEGADLTARTAPAQQPAESADAGANKPWWEQEKPKLNELKIEDLASGADEVLASRMVKGFYVAVDKQFKWQGRNWYRSTKGYVAPVDRFHLTSGSDFKGVELGDTWKLPVAWVHGASKSKPRYQIDPQTNQLRRDGTVERFSAINLTGEAREVNKRTYLQTADGHWVRDRDVRVTKPGPIPEGVADGERWLDINLETQTVVLFSGTEPIYATLISSGKTHPNKEKDHSTPTGEFRIETKHIAATMDGDGSAAGDLPYSIEAVPYVMYFHRSYALHGAFWHRNYGIKMSHGCVNLAPLDAKYIFFNTDPPVAQGLHGAWAKDDRPGSRVVVHH